MQIQKKLIVFAFSFACFVTIANAKLVVCNDSQETVAVALGAQDKNSWITQGWWHIAPLSCTALIKTPLKSRYYYIHAETGRADGKWEGPIFLCVKDKQFSINGVRDCYVRGYQKAGFQEIDTGFNNSWEVHLKPHKIDE